MPPLTFTCPRCGMCSHNPNDIQHGYCGNCHDFTGDEPPHFGELRYLTMGELRWLHGAVDMRLEALSTHNTPVANEGRSCLFSLRTAIAEAMQNARPGSPVPPKPAEVAAAAAAQAKLEAALGADDG